LTNGLDREALAAHLRAADWAERHQILKSYLGWLRDGARAQGWRGAVGAVLFGGMIFLLFDMLIEDINSPLLLVFCMAGALLGASISYFAFRREREWRRQNPFKF
jgi:hypothetical protein